MTRTLYDNRNQRVELGPLRGEGGEGLIFDVVGLPSSLAKIYKNPPDRQKVEKLKAMPALARPDLLAAAGWPTATLHQTPQGSLVGFLMPRVPGKEAHALYGPAHRRMEFPSADWDFLIRAATSCATAFDVIHRCGHTIGDVNQSNVFVSHEAVVHLIDCDSYQVNAGGTSFLCEVGVPLFTPPDLQGQSFRGVVRNHNHDRFGLAVLIFHLIFVGRHPFAGRPLTKGELTPDKAIKEFRFAYSRAAAQLQIAPPLHAPLLDIVPAEVGRLFERAFSAQSVQPGARPTAQEWAAALSTLQKQLKVCTTDEGHTFSAHLGQCCWCALMQSGALNYFVSVTVYRHGVPSLTFVLGPAWAEIDRVPRPNTTYSRPPLSPGRLSPTALPAHIPSRVPYPVVIPPPQVAPPTPVSRARVPPPVVIPPPRVRRLVLLPLSSVPPPVVVPRESLHKVVGWAAVTSVCLLPVVLGILLVTLVVTPAPLASAGQSCGSIAGFGGFVIASCFVSGTVWLLLEMKHQAASREANAPRETALAALERENASRREAFNAAIRAAKADWTAKVRKANAERDAILAEVEQEEVRRREAYETALRAARDDWAAKVREAKAERERIIAALELEKARRLHAYQKARRELEEAEYEWRQTAERYEQSFDGLKRDLERRKYEYLSLKPQYEQEYRQLERNREADQRTQYLQNQFISEHDIPAIGPGRKALLESNGIETAYDIDRDRILDIDGFGDVLTGNLVNWREEVARRFSFNASAAVSRSELAALVVKYKQFQQRIEAKLQTGLTELRGCSEKASRHLPQLYARLPGLMLRLAQAQVDAQVLSDDGI